MVTSVVSRLRNNLPADVTSFIGRRRELGKARKLLQHVRLITFTGLGGVGKTRLALRAAAEVRRAFPDGVWFVELASLRDDGLISQSVAAVLGFVEPSTASSMTALCDLIGDRQMLIVLDNCEHLIDGSALLADTLLRRCSNVKVVATSRQPLRISGEHVLEVEPLETPAATPQISVQNLSLNDAVTLFVERVAAIQPGFVLEEDNAATVASICRRLDGIPLALELGAGRLRALSPSELLTRLDSRYEVLVGGSRAALPRQQTLRALIDWSFSLCTRDEKLLWARLSMFADGFTLASAEQVCSDDKLPASAILITIEGLVEKSIVSPVRDLDRVRYRLAETLREYGADRLREYDESAVVHKGVRDWVQTLVDRMQSGWVSSSQAELLSTLRREHANIQLALQYCLTTPGEARSGLVIASGLRHYWTASGRLGEGRHWLGRLLAIDREPTVERVRGLCTCAFLTTGPGESDTVDQMLDEAEMLSMAFGEQSGIDLVGQIRGISQLFRGNPGNAVRLLEAAATGARHGGDLGATVNDLALLGLAKVLAGESGASLALDECIALCANAGESWFRATALWTVGLERCLSGDLASATAAQCASLELRLPLGGWYPIATNLDVLAWVAVEAGDPERAARLFGAAEAIMRDLGEFLVSRGPTASLHKSYLERSRGILGATEFESEFDVGLQMVFDVAVAYALGTLTSPDVPRPRAEVLGAASSKVLTAREFEVARLVARGFTNRQIAVALVISPRTAEGHVEHVLAKLGFTSRAQIATWATQQESS